MWRYVINLMRLDWDTISGNRSVIHFMFYVYLIFLMKTFVIVIILHVLYRSKYPLISYPVHEHNHTCILVPEVLCSLGGQESINSID